MWFSCLCYVLLIMWSFHWVKKWGKNQEGSLWWDMDHCNNSCELHQDQISRNNWHPETSEITILSEKAGGIHSHVQHGSKTTRTFLPDDGKVSWSLLPSSISLLLCGTGQPEINIPVSLRWQVRSEKADNHLIVINLPPYIFLQISPNLLLAVSTDTKCFYPWLWVCISKGYI